MMVDDVQWEVEKIIIFITKYPLLDFFNKI